MIAKNKELNNFIGHCINIGIFRPLNVLNKDYVMDYILYNYVDLWNQHNFNFENFMEFAKNNGYNIEKVDDLGDNLLMIASKMNYIDLVKTLIKLKVNLNTLDFVGRNALFISVINKNIESAAILIDAGSEINLTFNGNTILDYAKNWVGVDSKLVNLLKSKGAK